MSANNIQLRVANWINDKGILAEIRKRVFIEEQKVPEELEWDEYDTISTHFIALINDKPVASARLKPDGQIGRMAVLAEYRNQGIGGKLLQFVLKNVVNNNFKQVYLHAQLEAVPFYKKHGFIEYDEIFFEANIPHRAMLKKYAK